MVVSINEKEDAHRLPRADEEPPDLNLTFTLVEKKWISNRFAKSGKVLCTSLRVAARIVLKLSFQRPPIVLLHSWCADQISQ